MRAVTVNKADGPDSITVENRGVREPRPGEVRLRVTAAAVNPIDVFMWRRAVEPPFTPGMDAAGTVESVGHAIGRLAVGDPVMAVVSPWLPEGGAQAELVVVRASSVVRMPRGANAVEAATLPMNGLTALEGLRMLDLAPGSTLVVTGGAGLLASYVIALARQRGICVIADAGPGDEALVSGFGADDVLPRGDGFADAVRALRPGGADAVFDTATLTRAVLPAIRDAGAIAVVRGWDGGEEPGRGITVHPVSIGNAMHNTDWLQELSDEATAGHIHLRVADLFPPERAIDAYRLMEAGGLRGRAVITF
jgi:NADPH:quinone reductase-like Zn-dependent oxidoreductase